MKFALSLPVLCWERNSTLIACHSHSHCFILIVILIACDSVRSLSLLVMIGSLIQSLRHCLSSFLLQYEIVCRCTIIKQHIKEKKDEQCLISSKALIWILPAKGRNVAEGHKLITWPKAIACMRPKAVMWPKAIMRRHKPWLHLPPSNVIS